jgi:8-oxo-dGTP diphosphatase
VNFPKTQWRNDQATFVRGESVGFPTPAALVFPFYGDKVVLAEIPGRGWCIPSGHLEPGEKPEAAARREAFEEAGVTLGRVVCLGYFVLTDTQTGTIRHAPTFIADVQGLSELPEGSESRGRLLANLEDIDGLYYHWDDLLAAVFEEAATARESLLPSGVALSAFTAPLEQSPEAF